MEIGLCKMNPETQAPPSGRLEVCTGCGACAAVCPHDSITMCPDTEGFLYPLTDAQRCNDCGLCRKTCPVNLLETFTESEVSRRQGTEPLSVFAAWHLDETIRHASSSGGVFTALAESILAQGGAVAGAAFDDQFIVRHILIESSTELHRLRGSKYVQSEIAQDLYHQIQDRLKQGRPVLFSGTPCQVAGLRSFLRKAYRNLFCCDIICHGVPSPWLFERYIHTNNNADNILKSISFRDKSKGWKNFCLHLFWQHNDQCLLQCEQYLAVFMRDYALRPSCYDCQFTTVTRSGDLTIADFWGVASKYPEYDRDDKGTSLVLVNSDKGKVWLDGSQSSLFLGPADLDTAVEFNPMLVRSCARPSERDTFYLDLKTLSFDAIVRKYRLHGPTKLMCIAGKAKYKLKALLLSCFHGIRYL